MITRHAVSTRPTGAQARRLLLVLAVSAAALVVLILDHQGGSNGVRNADVQAVKARTIGGPKASPKFDRIAKARARKHDRFVRSKRAIRERKASRTRYVAMSAPQAKRVAIEKQPAVAKVPAWQAPPLQKGERIVAYPSASVARLRLSPDEAKKSNGATSMLIQSVNGGPLAAPDATGNLKGIDLGFVDDASAPGPAWRPKLSAVATSIPKNSDQPVELGDQASPNTLKIRIPGQRSTASVLSGQKAFYANTGVDTDTIVEPVATGVSFNWILRSVRSARSQRLDFELGDGANLRVLPDGSAAVMRGSHVTANISAPEVRDAQGTEIAATYAVDESSLIVNLDATARDVSYPIAIDPVVEWWPDGAVVNQGVGGWYSDSTPYGLLDQLYFSSSNTNRIVGARFVAPDGWPGARIRTTSASGFAYAAWIFDPVRSASVVRTYWQNVKKPLAGVKLSVGIIDSGGWIPSQWGGYYTTAGQLIGGANSQFVNDYPYVMPSRLTIGNCSRTPQATCAATGPSNSVAYFELATQPATPADRTAETTGVFAWISDNDSPTLNRTSSAPASVWQKVATQDVTYSAADNGVGLGSIHSAPEFPDSGHPGSAIQWTDNGTPWNDGKNGHNIGPICNGDARVPCPSSFAGRIQIGQGRHDVKVRSMDIIGHTSNQDQFTVKLDNQAPEIALTGRLGSYALNKKTLGDSNPRTMVDSAPFQIVARDGTPATAPGGNPATEQSGVKTLSARVNKSLANGAEDTVSPAVLNFPEQQTSSDCDEDHDGTKNSCKLTLSGTFDTSSLDPGVYYFRVSATDWLGNSKDEIFKVGVGVARLNGLREGRSTARFVPLSVTRIRGSETSYRLQYRNDISDQGAWCDVPSGSVKLASSGAAISGWPQSLTGSAGQDLVVDLSAVRRVEKKKCDDAPELLKDGELRLRAVMGSPDGTDGFSRASEDITINYDHGGKDTNDETQEIGPGSVDLVTGNFSMSATDVSVNAFLTNMQVGRTYNSRYSSDNNSVLGAGWQLGLPEGEAGAFTKLTDNADVRLDADMRDPSVQIETNDGSTLWFELSSTSNDDGSDRYITESGLENFKLKRLQDTFDPSRTVGFELTDRDSGAVYSFERAESIGVWNASGVSTPAQSNQIRYQYEPGPGGKAIVSNAYSATGSSGINCGENWQNIPRGCQALHFEYSMFGSFKRLWLISLRTWDPASSQMTTAHLAQFDYDASTGTLKTAWDPRNVSLKTTYAYTTVGAQQLLTSITPPGEDPITLTYSKLAEDNNDGRLASVTRSGATTQARYYVPTTTAVASSAPWDMTTAEVAKWGQPAAPWMATAVFSPDQPPNGTPATNYDRAQVNYLDAFGRKVNTLEPGGRLDMTQYNEYGEVTRSLTAENRRRAMALGTAQQRLDAANRWDSRNEYADVPGSLQERRHLVRSSGPEHQVRLDNNTWTQARTVTDYTYDEGSPITSDPSKEPFDLVTTTKESALHDGVLSDTRTTKQYYGTTEDEWKLRTPRLTTTDPNGLQVKRKVSLNSDGLETERFQPRSQSSSQPSTTKTIYYTSGANADDSSCANKPEWIGLPCKLKPGAQPTTSGLPKLPEKTITYNLYRQPVSQVETIPGSASTRTTTMTYDGAGRPVTEEITSSTGTAIKKTTHIYSDTNGRETQTRSLNADGTTFKTVSRAYDSQGRQVAYTDADGHQSSTTYDILSRPISQNDGKATRTNSYDPITGDLTQVNDSGAGIFTASYDDDGRAVTTTLPGGIVKSVQIDESGTPVYITYDRTTGCASDCRLYDQWAVENAHGQYNGLWSDTKGQDSTTEFYDYDAAGRLKQTQDWRSSAGTNYCELRRYSYDEDSNRTKRRVNPDQANDCAWSSTGNVQTNTYDNADRLTNSGYTYDPFGRITTVPAADTGAPGNITTTYYANDLVRSITQNGSTQTFELDPNLRVSMKTRTGTGASTETYAYTDDSDSPAWTQTTAGSQTTWTRTVDGIGAAEAVQSSTGGVKLMLQNLRGDVVAQSSAGGTLSDFSKVDEFGVPKAALPGGAKYAFHGSKQREAVTSGGIVLMGVRLYQPQMGRFLQVDPVLGGTANPYEYPSDPVNGMDLDGRGLLDLAGKGLARALRSSRAARYLKKLGIRLVVKARQAARAHTPEFKRLTSNKKWPNVFQVGMSKNPSWMQRAVVRRLEKYFTNDAASCGAGCPFSFGQPGGSYSRGGMNLHWHDSTSTGLRTAELSIKRLGVRIKFRFNPFEP